MVIIICQILLCVIYTTAYENLALRRPAWQQHNYSGREMQWGAAKAVDGLYTDRSAGGNQCTQSNNRQTTATWRVDLESVVSISHIDFYYRTDNLPIPSVYTTRFAGFYLYVSNTTSKDDGHLCFHEIQTVDGTPIENQTISCSVHGRYVIYYNERKPGVNYPSYYSQYAFNELCEVEVNGCPDPRYYGVNCNQPCPDGCQEKRCDVITSQCLGCIPGYQGPRCSQGKHTQTGIVSLSYVIRYIVYRVCVYQVYRVLRILGISCIVFCVYQVFLLSSKSFSAYIRKLPGSYIEYNEKRVLFVLLKMLFLGIVETVFGF
ncbi:uncharacterized protein LOC130049109 isoform X2 [Ostrea edulis]|uniref:uncharacterized protein LOC130049109 isoform X2 n=1 Tax=Ostrea edulis TaxID=37623 RepID=UPI0024AF9DFD|nr:uncharacterized protein LOC130049109 isoform X2 [Ostrea edulis]